MMAIFSRRQPAESTPRGRRRYVWGVSVALMCFTLFSTLTRRHHKKVIPQISQLCVLVEPRLNGVTKSGHAYEVRAQRSLTDRLQGYVFTYPWTCISKDGHKLLWARALKGVFKDHLLHLSGSVEAATSNHYRLRTQKAVVFLQEERVQTLQPVTGQGPLGTFSADQLVIEKDALTLTGKVHLVLEESSAEGSSLW